MNRTRLGSLAAGGLNWNSLPLKLFAGGNAKFWNPADIDFSRDREDWERLSEPERHYATLAELQRAQRRYRNIPDGYWIAEATRKRGERPSAR